MDSSTVADVKNGIDLVMAAITAVTAVIGFIAGRVHALRKKRK